MTTSLTKLDAIAYAIEKANSIGDLKDIRDKAKAIGQYLKTQKTRLSDQNRAAELKLRAERKIGCLIPIQYPRGRKTSRNVRLKDNGISWMQSHRWQDMKENTDLVVLKAEGMRIACRVRRPHYYPRYDRQFTIRKSVPSGAKTEYEKIRAGFGDWMFYGFSTPSFSGIYPWWILNLNRFRCALANPIEAAKIIMGECVNDDASCLYWFSIPSIQGITISRRHPDDNQLPFKVESPAQP